MFEYIAETVREHWALGLYTLSICAAATLFLLLCVFGVIPSSAMALGWALIALFSNCMTLVCD